MSVNENSGVALPGSSDARSGSFSASGLSVKLRP
jgi:hypothetical protein